MTYDLKTRFGPTALITGASDGIGRAFAEALAAHGFSLVLVARRETVLQALAQTLGAKHGVNVRVIAADLSDPQATARILMETESLSVGLLVAAAGFGSIGPFLAQDVASEVNMVDVNCRSVVALTHGIAGRMATARKGGIVLFGSLVGFQGVPGSATYAATKGFVQGFAEGLEVELRPLGISVLSVAPGPVGTGFAARAGMQMGRAETPETVARASLRALPRGGTVRPGVLAKLLGWSLAAMPRWGRVRVLGQIMTSMMTRTKV
ncbi:MAG: SDR family oxidoreductase [Alphaproteobacteria bacterium]|nr:SDR family oxidoreductase [Alphaproteobacteria bacterium]